MLVDVSIIIPFYNTPHLMLRKALDSILEQSFINFEVLLINDGSKKDYSHLEKEYSQDKRIKFFTQENLGVSAARNKGIEIACGKYIVFHDADDFVENNFLYSLVKNIRNADLVVCSIDEQWFPVSDGYMDIRSFLSKPSMYNYVQYTNFSVNKLFKRDILIDNHIKFDTTLKLGEDALFISDYLKHCRRIRTIRQRLYHYIPHASSATNKYDEKYWDYEKSVISTQLKMFSTYPLNEFEQAFLSHWLYIKIRGCLFYYLWHEKNIKLRDNILNEILNSSFIDEVYDCNKDVCFSKVDKLVIILWKKYKLSGIKLSYYAKLLSNKYGFIKRFLLM